MRRKTELLDFLGEETSSAEPNALIAGDRYQMKLLDNNPSLKFIFLFRSLPYRRAFW